MFDIQYVGSLRGPEHRHIGLSLELLSNKSVFIAL